MTEPLHEVITLLIERMETNPEDFITNKRLVNIAKKYMDYLQPHEQEAYNEACRKMYMRKFHEEVMAELLNPKEEAKPAPKPKTTQTIPNSKTAEWLKLWAEMEEMRNKKREAEDILRPLRIRYSAGASK